MTHLNQNIAAKLMESVLAAFRSETADLERLAEEVDAAGQDVGKIRTSIEQYAKRRTQAMETIHSMLQADAAEFREAPSDRSDRCPVGYEGATRLPCFRGDYEEAFMLDLNQPFRPGGWAPEPAARVTD